MVILVLGHNVESCKVSADMQSVMFMGCTVDTVLSNVSSFSQHSDHQNHSLAAKSECLCSVIFLCLFLSLALGLMASVLFMVTHDRFHKRDLQRTIRFQWGQLSDPFDTQDIREVQRSI